MIIINTLVLVTAIYLAAGFLFALAFVTAGVTRIDEGAKGSGWGFRVIIIPGTIIFWPFLLKKWLAAGKTTTHD